MKLVQALAVYGVRPETVREAFARRWGHDDAPVPNSREQEQLFLQRTALDDERQWLTARLEDARHPLTRHGQAWAVTRLLSLNATLALPYATDSGQRTTWDDYERWRQLADEYRRIEYANHRHLPRWPADRDRRAQRLLWLRMEITLKVPGWESHQ